MSIRRRRDVGRQIGVIGGASGPGLSSRVTISRSSGSLRRSHGRACTPATSEATSSGSDSELVRICGLAVGVGRAQPHPPARLGRDEHRRDHHRVAVVTSQPRGPRSRRRPCGTGCRRRAGPRGCGEMRTTSATVELSGPLRRSTHSATHRGCSAVSSVSSSETSKITVTNGWSWRFLPTPGQLVADGDADRAQLVGRADPRQLQQLGRADRAGREDHLTVGPDHLIAAAAGAQRTPTARPPSSSTPSTVAPVRTFEVGPLGRRAQVGVGGAEAPAATG